jgi:hypothetical protein
VGCYLGRIDADGGVIGPNSGALEPALVHVQAMNLPDLHSTEALRATLIGESSERALAFDEIQNGTRQAQVYPFFAFAFAVAASPGSVSSLASDDLNALAWAWSREIAQAGNPIVTKHAIDSIYSELDRLRSELGEAEGGSKVGANLVLHLLIEPVEQGLNAPAG